METYPKCPHCDMYLDYNNQLSTDYDDVYYFVRWSASCPECQRTFLFTETFKLVERTFINEED